MAIVSKEFDLYAWRNNNINIVAVSQENNGKEIVFNLYTEATQSKLLNSNSKDYIPHLYVNLPNNKSAYVIGTLDKTNSKVTFTLDSCVLPTCGRFNCFVSLICDDTIIKFAGMTLCVLDGSISDYVDNTSKTDSYDVLVSNVNYLMDKIDNVVSNFDIANLETLSAYPNVSNNCLKSPCNFQSTNNWNSSNDGSLGITDLCLAVQSSQTTDLLGELIKEKEVNKNNIMLVKIRMKMVSGQYVCVYPIYSTSDGVVNVTTDNIIASNLRPTSRDYLLTDNDWHNIWFIFDCDTTNTITNIGVRLSPSSNVIISNINAFYSLDKTTSTNSSEAISVVYDIDNTTVASQPITAEEVEL